MTVWQVLILARFSIVKNRTTLKLSLTQFAREILKSEIRYRVRFDINTKPNCAKLSELIFIDQNTYISESTLYRFFLYPKKHHPYQHTLEALCRFAGFNSCIHFFEYVANLQDKLASQGLSTTGQMPKSLIYHCIEHEAFKPLLCMFEDAHDDSITYKNLLAVHLFDGLYHSKNSHRFFKKLSGNKFVREFFFEKNFDPRFRIKSYEFGFHHYLLHINIEKDINDFQDHIFASSVLFRHYFINNEYTKALNAGNNLYNKSDIEEIEIKNTHFYPYIRYTAYRLWHMQIAGKSKADQDEYCQYLISLCKSIKPKLDQENSKFLFHTLAEVFTFAKASDTFCNMLKKIYADEFTHIPESVKSKAILHSLPYFEMNGLLLHRP